MGRLVAASAEVVQLQGVSSSSLVFVLAMVMVACGAFTAWVVFGRRSL
jgi:anthranilate phosphoribosyltransferase